ncbi:MAG: O-antigen ligase family protein [Chloroflexota bacterium]
MTLRTRRLVQQIILFAIVLTMLLTHNSSVSLNVRLLQTGVALLALVAICSKRLRDSNLLFSPLDFGWLPYVLLTALTVSLAPFPRRSVEIWLWFIALQVPISYGALYLFRRGWPERGLYRALLGAGSYLYFLTVTLTLSYLAQAAAARAAGLIPSGFRLFGIMDHPNTFAMFIAIATPCMVAYLFMRLGKIERVAVILWLAGAALGIYGTGSRTGTVAAIAGSGIALALALLAHPSQPLQRFRVWAVSHRQQAGAMLAGMAVLAVVALGIVFYLQFGRPRQDDGGGRLSFYRSAITVFTEHPIAGYGPGGFFRNELNTHSVPLWRPMPHAHDMLLGTAAESGLLGLLGFGALLIVGAWTCVKVWRTQPTRRLLIAGPIGGLVGFCLSGILDSPINQFGPFFLATILLAYIASFLPAPQSTPRQWWRTGLIVATVAGIVVLCAVVLIPYVTVWSVTRPDRPVDTPDTTLAAAKQLDTVIAYDYADPLVTLQSGYEWAKLISSTSGVVEPQALQNAIARFERGIQLDPDLGMNALNLSALYLKANRPADAVKAAQRATQLSNQDSVAWLNLGIALEANGDPAGAQIAYENALVFETRWETTGFWQVTPSRQAALTQFRAANTTDHYYALLAQANTDRLAGRKSEALTAYQNALKISPGAVAQTYVQGLIALANDDLVAARLKLTQTTTMETLEIWDQIAQLEAWRGLGDLARDRGDTQEMLRDYNIAYAYLTSRGIGGFGTKGDWGYSIVGYQRFAQINDYLPDVVMLDITPDQIASFVAFAQANAANGQAEAAAAIYRQILEANPDNTEAKTALAQLASLKS